MGGGGGFFLFYGEEGEPFCFSIFKIRGSFDRVFCRAFIHGITIGNKGAKKGKMIKLKL